LNFIAEQRPTAGSEPVHGRNETERNGPPRVHAGESGFGEEFKAMKAIKMFLAGGVAIAALASAAPAAAQYYPGYGYGYPGYGGGNVIGQIINSVVGGGYGYNGYSPYGYNANSQMVVNQCANAIQARLSGGYNGYGYNGGYGGYGYNGYAYGGAARVLGISRVENRSSGGLTVRGVATSGRNVAYGYNQGQVDLVWKCRTDYRGAIIDLDIDPAQSNYGYNFNYNQYTPWTQDYSQYGYRRY
jgi:hypothetical protein